MQKLPRLILAFLYLVFGAGVVANAQVESAAPKAGPAVSPAPAAKTAPAPIPLADVVAAADTASQRLQQIEAEIAANETIDTIARELPILTQEIGARLAETERTLAPNAALETLRDMEARWQRVGDQLALWAGDLTTRAAFIDREIALLPDLRVTWRSTLDLARTSGAPTELTQRISDVLKEIDRTERTLQKRRATTLSLQSRTAEQTQRVLATLRAVKTAQSAAVNSLWVQDSPPIWAPDVRAAATHDLVARSQVSLSAQGTQLRAYVAREWTKLVYFALVLCGLSFALACAVPRITRCGEAWTDEDPSLARAIRILQRPLATASVLSFLLCPLLFSDAPRLFWVTLAAVALVPTVILLRHLVSRHLFPILNALIVFYVVAQVRVLSAALPMLSRVILLLEMIGGAVFALWFIRSTRTSGHASLSHRATRAAAMAGAAVFVLVFITNTLGYVALSNYLSSGALAAAYLAILLYAAARIVIGLLFFAMQVWPLASLGVVQRHRPLLHARLARVIYVAAFIGWVLGTLNAFSLRRAAIERATAFITAQFGVGSLHLSLGSVLTFVLTIWIAVLVSRFVRFVLQEDIYGRLGVAPGSSFAISTILHYIILIGGILAALTAIGVDMTKLAILAGALSVGIGFGLQNIFNNFFSGLILLLERPVRVGDVIEVAGVSGVVRRIGIRASKIRLGDSSVLIVPNGQLISEKVTNRTVPSRQARIDLRVRVAYESDPKRVIELLTKVAAAHPLAASTPPPEAFMKEFGADALVFDLMCWTDDPSRALRLHSDVAVAVNGALREAGIGIPAPHRCF